MNATAPALSVGDNFGGGGVSASWRGMKREKRTHHVKTARRRNSRARGLGGCDVKGMTRKEGENIEGGSIVAAQVQFVSEQLKQIPLNGELVRGKRECDEKPKDSETGSRRSNISSQTKNEKR